MKTTSYHVPTARESKQQEIAERYRHMYYFAQPARFMQDADTYYIHRLRLYFSVIRPAGCSYELLRYYIASACRQKLNAPQVVAFLRQRGCLFEYIGTTHPDHARPTEAIQPDLLISNL